MLLFFLGVFLGVFGVLGIWWRFWKFCRMQTGWVCSTFFSQESLKGVVICCDCESPEGLCLQPGWKLLCLVDLQVGFLDLFEDARAFFSFSGILGQKMVKRVARQSKLFEQALSCAPGVVIYGALTQQEFVAVRALVQPLCPCVFGGVVDCEGVESLQGSRIVVILHQVANSRLADLLQARGAEVVLVQKASGGMGLSRARKNLYALLGVLSVQYIVGTQESLDFFFSKRVKEFGGIPICAVRVRVQSVI